MKNVKFTLGLAFSMLFMGATVSHATYDNTAPHKGSIKVSLSIKASEFYTTSTVDSKAPWYAGNAVHGVQMEAKHKYSPQPFSYSPNAVTMAGLTKRDTSFSKNSWLYGANHRYTDANGKTVLCDYLYDYSLGRHDGNGLFFEHKVDSGYAINRTWVALKMVEGLDVNPVVKRIITYGNWEYSTKDSANILVSTGVAPIVETLTYTATDFRPEHDRESGVATFYYEEDILALMEKYVIYSIDYQISVNEIMGETDGSEDGPIVPEVTVTRAVTFDAEDGIMTVPSALAGTHYVPSNKDFTFTVYSPNDITVTTSRGRDNEGVKKVSNGDGTYTVTIVKVQQALTISIKSVKTESGTGEDGTTGNEGVTEDKVWSANGTLYVNAANPATLSVYTVTGQLYKQAAVSGSYTATLPKGLYIVQLNGKAYKVVL